MNSIEEKATRYDEAKYIMKEYLESGNAGVIAENTIKKAFPELAESEDEKMRAMAIKAVYAPEAQSCIKSWGINPDDVIVWLEKQGEQKPVFEMKTPEESLGIDSGTYSKIVDECVYGEQKPAWSEEDEKQARQIERIVHNDGCSKKLQEQIANWFKSLKYRVQPQTKQEWSEEDKEIIDYLIDYLESELDSSYTDLDKETFTKEINWLKSLRPHQQWKPSDEKMEYLAKAITTLGYEGNCKTASILNDLRVELKKLREE